MSWDIRQNLQTGDWVFDSKRDLQGVEAEYLVQQRIHVRLMVERGEFIYDQTGTLGSRLRSVLSMGVGQGAAGLEMLIREALEPMTDIAISSIDVNTFGDGSNVVTDPRLVKAHISYNIILSLDDDVVSTSSGQVTTDVTIPIY